MDAFRVECLASPDAADKLELKVTGSLTIGEASRFKEVLLETLNTTQELRLDLSEVTEIDLAGLQLLCAAHHLAQTRGKFFSLGSGEYGIFHDVAKNAGFLRQAGCAQDLSGSSVFIGGEE